MENENNNHAGLGGAETPPKPPKSFVRRFGEIFGKIEDGFLALTIIVLIVVIFGQVLSRYLLNISLAWPDEVSRIFLVWITFVGTAAVMKRKGHMGLEFLSEAVGEKRSQIVEFIIAVLTMFFAAVVFIAGWQMALQGFQRLTPALHIQYFIIYLSIPVGFLLVFIRSLFEAIARAKAYFSESYRAELLREKKLQAEELDFAE